MHTQKSITVQKNQANHSNNYCSNTHLQVQLLEAISQSFALESHITIYHMQSHSHTNNRLKH